MPKSKVNPKLKKVNVESILKCIDPASGIAIGELSKKDLQRSLYINNVAVLHIQQKYMDAIGIGTENKD